MTVNLWSQTAATNATADSTVNWREGQAPSTVNNSSRAMMAAIAKWRDDQSGNIETGGSSTAYTVTSNQSLAPLADGYTITVRMHTANGASATLNVDSTGAKAIRTGNATALVEGALTADSVHRFTYDSDDDCWYINAFFTTTSLPLSGLLINGATAVTTPAADDEAPIYDASATANRKITLANLLKVITALTAETAPAVDDELALYDLSATATDKITLANLFKVINAFTGDTTPDREADFVSTYDDSASAPKKVLIKNLPTPGAIMVIAEHQESSGEDGDAIPDASNNVRTINTLVFNRNTIASLSSNRLTLPAGTWEISWEAVVGGDPDNGFHQSFLYNQSDSTEVKRGTTGQNNTTSGQTLNLSSCGCAVVTIAASKAFEVRHAVDTSNGGFNEGDAAGFGTEVYLRVIVRAG